MVAPAPLCSFCSLRLRYAPRLSEALAMVRGGARRPPVLGICGGRGSFHLPCPLWVLLMAQGGTRRRSWLLGLVGLFSSGLTNFYLEQSPNVYAWCHCVISGREPHARSNARVMWDPLLKFLLKLERVYLSNKPSFPYCMGKRWILFWPSHFSYTPHPPSITQGFLKHQKEITEEWEVDGSHMMFYFEKWALCTVMTLIYHPWLMAAC